MTRDLAERLSLLLVRHAHELDASVALVRESQGSRDFSRYRDAVSRILLTQLTDVLNPLYIEHPDLKPREMGGPYELPRDVAEAGERWCNE
jgi:hypothetical protein